MRKPVSVFSSLSLCFTSHKKEYNLLSYPLLFEGLCSCDKFKAFFLFIWYPIYSLILVNFIVANWDVSFWFIFVFCQKKKWYVHLHVDIHSSEKLFLFFILNLWGGCEKCLPFVLLYNPVVFLREKKKWIFIWIPLRCNKICKNLLVSCLLSGTLAAVPVKCKYFTVLFLSKSWTLLALNYFFKEYGERKSFSLQDTVNIKLMFTWLNVSMCAE